MICSSVNLDFFIASPYSLLRSFRGDLTLVLTCVLACVLTCADILG